MTKDLASQNAVDEVIERLRKFIEEAESCSQHTQHDTSGGAADDIAWEQERGEWRRTVSDVIALLRDLSTIR